MARGPENRDATALKLAADIEHWLADEPVAAYAEPWRTRARRWFKRYRTPVTAVVATLLATLLLSGAGWLWLAQDRAQRRAETARAVDAALTEATLLRGQAKAAPAGERAAWSAALAAAKRAETLLET